VTATEPPLQAFNIAFNRPFVPGGPVSFMVNVIKQIWRILTRTAWAVMAWTHS